MALNYAILSVTQVQVLPPLLGDGARLAAREKETEQRSTQSGKFQGKAPERQATGWAGWPLAFDVGQVALPCHSYHSKVKELGLL